MPRVKIPFYNDECFVGFYIDSEFIEETSPHKYREIDVSLNDLDQYNGNHIVFGEVECFRQSDEAPWWIGRGQVRVKIEHEN